MGRFRGLWGPQGYGRGLRILQGAREQSTWTRPMIKNALSSLESQAAWPRQGPPPTLAQRSPWKEATPIMPGAPLWADYPALVDRGGADMGDPDPAGRHAMREQVTQTQPPAGPTSLPMDFTFSSLLPTPHPSLRNPHGGVACLACLGLRARRQISQAGSTPRGQIGSSQAGPLISSVDVLAAGAHRQLIQHRNGAFMEGDRQVSAVKWRSLAPLARYGCASQ